MASLNMVVFIWLKWGGCSSPEWTGGHTILNYYIKTALISYHKIVWVCVLALWLFWMMKNILKDLPVFPFFFVLIFTYPFRKEYFSSLLIDSTGTLIVRRVNFAPTEYTWGKNMHVFIGVHFCMLMKTYIAELKQLFLWV